MVQETLRLWLGLCLVCAGLALPLRAAEPEPPASRPQQQESADEDARDSEAPPETPLAKERKPSDLDDALLEKLTGSRNTAIPPAPTTPAPTESATPEGEPVDPLERAIQSMRNVSERIGEKQDTGQETREIQAQIVRDLAKLIKQAQQQQQNSANAQQQLQRRKQNQLQREEKPSQDRNQPQQQTQNPPQGGDSGQRNKDASQSTERTDEAEKMNAELQQREFLVKDVWGHLPPAIREQMLTIYRDKTLPKYEDLVREYFRALAESSRKRRQGK